jgi:hypothetical protein
MYVEIVFYPFKIFKISIALNRLKEVYFEILKLDLWKNQIIGYVQNQLEAIRDEDAKQHRGRSDDFLASQKELRERERVQAFIEEQLKIIDMLYYRFQAVETLDAFFKQKLWEHYQRAVVSFSLSLSVTLTLSLTLTHTHTYTCIDSSGCTYICKSQELAYKDPAALVRAIEIVELHDGKLQRAMDNAG